MWHQYFAKIVQDQFQQATNQKKDLSLRAYAKSVGISAGVLSEILRSKRQVSADRALEIANELMIDSEKINYLKKLIGKNPNHKNRKTIPNDAIKLIVDPNYYRTLCALEILPTPCQAQELATFLKLDLDLTQSILAVLKKFEIVDINEDQIWWSGQNITTTEDIPNETIQFYHKQILKTAEKAIKLPPLEREFTAITFAANSSKLPEAKQQIRSFRDVLAQSMLTDSADSIYQLSIQLIPVSKKYSAFNKDPK